MLALRVATIAALKHVLENVEMDAPQIVPLLVRTDVQRLVPLLARVHALVVAHRIVPLLAGTDAVTTVLASVIRHVHSHVAIRVKQVAPHRVSMIVLVTVEKDALRPAVVDVITPAPQLVLKNVLEHVEIVKDHVVVPAKKNVEELAQGHAVMLAQEHALEFAQDVVICVGVVVQIALAHVMDNVLAV